jgi:hypothetical protein
VIRSQFDALGSAKSKERINGSQAFGEIAEGQGLTLMVTKVDGRWYLSPLLTALDAVNTATRTPRGGIPDTLAKGAATPGAAAEAAVLAVPRIAEDGLKALAPYLSAEEADALYLFGDAVPNLRDTSIDIRSANFTSGPTVGNRAMAVVGNVSFTVNSAATVAFSPTCVSQQGDSTRLCLNGSGYIGPSSSSYGEPLPYLADHGKFALTTVKEDNGWKVSVLDTIADHAISWVNSITRDQALAMLGWQRADKPAATLALGTESTVKFNSAGYAVMKLVLPESVQLQLSDDSGAFGTLYDATGEQVGDLYGGSDSIAAGTYTVVLHADSKWDSKFARAGNKVAYSAPITVEQYIEPPTVDGQEGTFSGVLDSYYGNGETSFDVEIPEGNDVNLVLTITGVNGDDTGSLNASVEDNGDVVEVPLVSGERSIVPLSSGTTSNRVSIWLSGSYAQVGFDLEFESK